MNNLNRKFKPSTKKILAIIPARAGSKGLPGKNIIDLCGKPMLTWTIEQAIQSNSFDRIIVSTDSKLIADIAVASGAEVPYLRSQELSSDQAHSIDVVIDIINFYQAKGIDYDYVMMLEPTSPLRVVGDIKGSIDKLFKSPEAEAIVGVCKTDSCHPTFLFGLKDGFLSPHLGPFPTILRRQDLVGEYFYLEGTIYLSLVSALIREKSFYHSKTMPWIIPPERSKEVDTFHDFLQVEALMRYSLKATDGSNFDL